MTRYRWLLFDLDNTLFDYDRAEREAMTRSFAEIGRPVDAGLLEQYRRINGELWRAFEQGGVTQEHIKVQRFARLLDAAGIDADPTALSKHYLFHLSQGTFLIDGAEELVRSLHGRYRLLLITNGLKDVQRPRIAHSTIGAYFEGFVISEEVGAAKPDGRIFDVAFELMERPDRSEVLMIGDSLSSDIAGGRAYGIDTCWFNPSDRPAEPTHNITYVIGDLAQLAPLLEY
jgi:2-haloacid dehalogenase